MEYNKHSHYKQVNLLKNASKPPLRKYFLWEREVYLEKVYMSYS